MALDLLIGVWCSAERERVHAIQLAERPDPALKPDIRPPAEYNVPGSLRLNTY
jgi:hypothetical protein